MGLGIARKARGAERGFVEGGLTTVGRLVGLRRFAVALAASGCQGESGSG